MEESLKPPTEDAGATDGESDGEAVSKAASELGKRSAAKRAEQKAKATADDETAPSASTESAEPKAEAGPKKDRRGDPRHDPTARVQEATREAAEARRELVSERTERQRLAAEMAQVRAVLDAAARGQRGAPAERAQNGGKPTEEEYENYADFVEARARWAARQEYSQVANYAAQQHAEAKRTERIGKDVDAMIERVTAASPNWGQEFSQEVLSLTPSFMLPAGGRVGGDNIVADEIVRSQHGPGLMAHFTANPTDLQRIASLRTPREIAREMAKLEARLDAATTGDSAKAESSKAKPPVRPVTGSPQDADPTEPTDDLPFDEWVRRANAKDRRARSAARG